MPSYPVFNDQIEKIYEKFMKDPLNKEKLGERGYKIYYHMHPNRRLKKMLLIFADPVRAMGEEANVPFFVITVNKKRKENKERSVCVYQNLYEGGMKEIELKFTKKEDEKSVEKNIRELQKIVKIVKMAFDNLHKGLRRDVNFYKQ